MSTTRQKSKRSDLSSQSWATSNGINTRRSEANVGSNGYSTRSLPVGGRVRSQGTPGQGVSGPKYLTLAATRPALHYFCFGSATPRSTGTCTDVKEQTAPGDARAIN